jgi:hypothetical protein
MEATDPHRPYLQGQLDFFCAVYAVINALRLLHGLNLEQGRGILGTVLDELSACPPLWRAVLHNGTDFYGLVDYLLGRFCGTGPWSLRLARLPESPPAGLPAFAAPAGDMPCLDLRSPPARSLEALASDLYRPESAAWSREGGAKEVDACPAWSVEALWRLLRGWLPGRRLLDFGSSGPLTRCVLLRFHRYLPGRGGPLISHWSVGRFFAGSTLHLYDCTAAGSGVQSLPLRESAVHPGDIAAPRLLGLEPQSLYFLEKAPGTDTGEWNPSKIL